MLHDAAANLRPLISWTADNFCLDVFIRTSVNTKESSDACADLFIVLHVFSFFFLTHHRKNLCPFNCLKLVHGESKVGTGLKSMIWDDYVDGTAVLR